MVKLPFKHSTIYDIYIRWKSGEIVLMVITSSQEWAMARIYSAVTPNSKASIVDAKHLIPKVSV